jgi:hypothetical protein
MRIGIDFDNTIVSYDALFHQLALEKALIPANLAANKTAVRDHLRVTNREEQWTLMQGEVYGPRMEMAIPYAHAIESIAHLKQMGHEIYIVSHKTKHPFMGPAYDLHESARNWISRSLLHNRAPLIEEHSIFYELTKEEKVKRICSLNCEVFIDDLPEILTLTGFPPHTIKILFDPDQQHTQHRQHFQTVDSWLAVPDLVAN